CAPATKPGFCARVRPLSEIITRQELARINATAFNTTVGTIAALPTIGLVLSPAEVPGLYRLGASEQAVLAEMIAVLGADTIRVGLEAETSKVGAPQFLHVEVRDYNIPAPELSVFSVSASNGPVD